tara:strand:+ start:149 stop:1150 length:1002 start_codon:yes stop_codon:yes gene_type:complete
MKVLLTGSSGFIGFHVAKRLIKEGFEVVGLDSMNDYYSRQLKEDRLSILIKDNNYEFHEVLLEDKDSLENIFSSHKFEYVINLAAQAGVRYSLTNPDAYISSNIEGFLNLLEICKEHNSLKHLLYASSSSVYGMNNQSMFSEADEVNHPISLYAATKRSNELMAHVYSNMYEIPMTGMRFFTVYGPWGRPDMALFHFTKSIIEGREIEIFNQGNMKRDFTYIDDIVEAVFRLLDHIPGRNEDISLKANSSYAPFKVFNIGNGEPVNLMDFLSTLEKKLQKNAIYKKVSMQPGDVAKTYANNEDLYQAIGYKPLVSVEEGVSNFVDWYKSYFNK